MPLRLLMVFIIGCLWATWSIGWCLDVVIESRWLMMDVGSEKSKSEIYPTMD